MEKYYNVMNRSGGAIGYSLPELNINRRFEAGETKKVSYNELEKLSFQPGGKELMAQYMLITDAEVLEEFEIHTEPEYFLTPEQVINLLQNGTVDELLDCLDFAPTGVIDLVKDIAFKMPLNDMSKREAIKDKTGFDITKALELNKEDKSKPKEEKVRRSAQSAAPAAPARRTAPKYTVVNKK